MTRIQVWRTLPMLNHVDAEAAQEATMEFPRLSRLPPCLFYVARGIVVIIFLALGLAIVALSILGWLSKLLVDSQKFIDV